jgi:putative ABC transport system permease protein
MLINYIKTAWRNLLKGKFFSLITLFGLALGLAIGILILSYVQDERSFDSFHRNTPEIYRMELFGGTGASKQIWQETVAPMGPLAKKEIPDVREQVRLSFNPFASIYKYKEKAFTDETAFFADPAFFTMFDFPLIAGNPSQPFADDHSVVITQSTATKFFGREDALGKVISTDSKDNFTVTGVIADFPPNSSFHYDMLMPMTWLANKMLQFHQDINHDFNGYQYLTFLQIRPGADLKSLKAKLNQIHLRNEPHDTDADYLLLPLAKMHLYHADGTDAGAQTVNIFTIIALLILAIASINYINLSTARAMLRSKEVSMRKIVGAPKFQLFLQFVIETTLLFLLAAGVAALLVWVSFPLLNEVSGKHLTFDPTGSHLWQVLGCTILATLAASSIYPAILLSSFDPLKALKSKLSISRGDANFRKVLVVVQFTASVTLIIGTIVIYHQLDYIRSKDLGYDKSHVLTFSLRNMRPQFETVKSIMLQQPGVLDITSATSNITNINFITGDDDWDGRPPNQIFTPHAISVDKEFFSFFKLKLLKGPGFSGTRADSNHFVLNEAAISETGIKDPIGKRFRIIGIDGTIVGVVKDFHTASLREKIGPMVFLSNSLTKDLMYIRTTGAAEAAVIRKAGTLFRQYNSEYPFNYSFLDDDYNKLYQAETREGTLFLFFAGIAIIISCLGLFALAAYTTQIRFREIGIRKVLGATVPTIVRLLAKDFIQLVLIAIVIAIPIAWYAMNRWLAGFAYRIDISWTIFLVSTGITVSISFLTISFQAVKAAVANPVKSIHAE